MRTELKEHIVFAFAITGIILTVCLLGITLSSPASAASPSLAPTWENVRMYYGWGVRTRVPEGWLLQTSDNDVLFIPDKEHGWMKPQVEETQ